MPSNLPERIDAPFDWAGEPPDPLDRPEYYDGLLWRRSVAFCVDACLLFAVVVVFWLFNILTFFIFTAVIFLIWAAPLFVIYDVATIGGSASATFGMRLLGLQVRAWDGGRPTYLHALIASALFWFLVPLTGGLILLVAPFSNRRQHVHDMLSGTVVINARAGEAVRIGGP
ncbi:MAG: RDD family protein [Alphaproteobacteria bacterium]|nr:RDD family protein [Alphaproteobacteria bacterium]